jgi:hypothetical protein
MVDSTKSSIFVGHPTTTRGHRLSIATSATHFFYGVKCNLVAKGRENPEVTSAVYTTNRDRITCVSLSGDGVRVAFGDDKGKVTIVKFIDGQFVSHKEHFVMGGIINEIIWTPDSNTIIALGENKG